MPSRKQQIEAVRTKASEFYAEVEALIEELESAMENMPDGIRDGQRGLAAQERIDTLQVLSDALSEAEDDLI